MRVLFWYCDHLSWSPTIKTLDDAPDGEPGRVEKAVAAWVHVEPSDVERAGKVVTKLVKTSKWLAGKWETRTILLASFAYLGEERAAPGDAKALLDRARARLESVDYEVVTTPWGYFADLDLSAPGHPLARVYKEL